MKTIKGPAIFLAQFAGDEAPYNTLDGMAGWAASRGYEGIQIPSWDARLFNLKLAAESKSYCDEVLGTASRHGLAVTELSTHLQGQLVASHPAFDPLLDAFAPAELAGNVKARQAWAVQQLDYAATASFNLGLKAHATFSGALAWPFFYPWPQRPAGLIDEAFNELARLWTPILERFRSSRRGRLLRAASRRGPARRRHLRALSRGRQQSSARQHSLRPQPHGSAAARLSCVPRSLSRARARVSRERRGVNPSGRAGVYGGYMDWIDRPGRFRSLGDGEVDFTRHFQQDGAVRLSRLGGLEWECCIKHPEDGAAEGAPFIRNHIIRVTEKAFDDFAGGKADAEKNRRVLGL